jgi:transcriptional regulator with XRE-family HTH domain
VALVRTAAEVGALARAARAARGWNQQQAADAAGLSRRFVNMLEGGEHTNAELWRVLALLDAVGVELHGTAPAPTPAPPPQPDDSATVTASPHREQTEAPGGFDLDAHLDAFRDPAKQP